MKNPAQSASPARLSNPERMLATENVLALFRGLPFAWEGANCIRLAREQALALGHDVPPVPRFRTRQGARRALRAVGVRNVAALLDRYFDRWPAPAFARLGDLVMLPADPAHGLDAVGIADGQGNIFCWHGATGFRQLEVVKFAAADVRAAWRL